MPSLKSIAVVVEILGRGGGGKFIPPPPHAQTLPYLDTPCTNATRVKSATDSMLL